MTILSWRCPVHGATADPLLLGGHVYCPDENCTREILRDRAAEARTISVVVLRPQNRPGSVRMRVESFMRASGGRVVTWQEIANAISLDTGRCPKRVAVVVSLHMLAKRDAVQCITVGRRRLGAGGWRWIGER